MTARIEGLTEHHQTIREARVGFRPRNAINAPDALNGDTVSFARLDGKSIT